MAMAVSLLFLLALTVRPSTVHLIERAMLVETLEEAEAEEVSLEEVAALGCWPFSPSALDA